MHLSIVSKPSSLFMNRTFYYARRQGKILFIFSILSTWKFTIFVMCSFSVSKHAQCPSFSPLQGNGVKVGGAGMIHSLATLGSAGGTRPGKVRTRWHRRSDSFQGLRIWAAWLPKIKHVLWLAAAQNENVGEAERVLQDANNVKAFRVRGWLLCTCVCARIRRVGNIMGLRFGIIAYGLLNTSYTMGPGGLGMLHGKSPLYVYRESNETAVCQKVFAEN